MNQLQALYRLQMLESSLDEAKVRLAEVETALQNDKQVKQALNLLHSRQQDNHRLHGVVTDLDLEIAALNTKMTEVEQMLFGGQISNPREVQERQDELESLKRRATKLNHELAAARQSHAQTQTAVQEAEEMLALAQSEASTENQELAREHQALQQDMRQWLQERKSVLGLVDPEHYRVYKTLKAKKKGVAVARLQEDACSVCRAEQNLTIIRQVRQAKEFTQCTNCARILVDF